MANKYDDADGVWRTIGGRRVFIRTGQSLSDAMIESGKFSRVKKNEELYKKIEEEPKLTEKQKDAAERLNKKAENGVRSDIKDFLSGKEDYDGTQEEFINDLSQEWGVDKEVVEDIFNEENTQHPRLFKTDRASEIKAKQEAVNKSFEENQKKLLEESTKYPKAEGATKFSDLGLEVSDEKAFSEYLQDKYGTDDFRVINFDNKEGAKQIYDEYASQREKDRVSQYFKDQEASALKNGDMTYGYSKETLANMSDEQLQEYIDRQQGLVDEYTGKYNQDLTYDQRVKRNKMDTIFDGASKTKYEKQLKDAQEELANRSLGDAGNWKEQIEANNAQLEKDLKAYQDTHDMARESEGYYELFRENERRNAAIKQEAPNEPYEFVESYATYKDKRDKLEGIERDANGRVDWDKVKDATWTGKEYTNDEFLENLEDENWHTERKMLLDAGLTNKQMEFVKNNTTFHNGSPSLDREITEELIKGAKGEKYRTPQEILSKRNADEISSLKEKLDTASKEGTGGTTTSYSSLKERYKQLSGKDYDDSNVKIPYDPKKTYTYSNGTKIDQNLMKERYSGFTPEQVKHDIDFNKDFLMNYAPKDREIHNAEIKEMEKYYNGMEKYESRISDDFTTSDWKEGYGNQWGEGSWKGSKSNNNLYGKDKIKAIDDEIRKAYPEIKTSRKTGRGGLTDSFSYNVMESDKPLIRSIDDFSDAEIERLYNSGYNQTWFKTKEDFKENLRKDLEKGYMDVNHYNIDGDYRLTPYGKQVMKDIMKVSNAYNYDESASQVDYFNTGHYINLGIGKYDKPYTIRATKATNAKMNDLIRGKKKK